MLGYLSKFVLQMLPTIAATVIGAYIVSTWVNPKTPQESTRTAARSQGQQTARVAYPVGQPAQDTVAEADEVTPPEKPAMAASAPETIRIIPIVKQVLPAADVAASAPAPAAEPAAAVDERRDATTLARAAIQRQRGGTEVRAAEDAVRPPVGRALQARPASEAPPPAATVAPPLPPAVTIAAPRYTTQADGDPAVSDRPTPPAEVPAARNPLSLHASHRVAEANPSPADEFINATRAFFRALTPQ
jgi:hypothetical protein